METMQGRPDDELIEDESRKQQKDFELEGVASGRQVAVNVYIGETVLPSE